MSQSTIQGLVARITSDRELIINRGARDGVEVDMIFKVLDDNAVDIDDPETGEILGSVNRVKVVVKVADVAERFCIARTFRTRRVNLGGVGLGGSSLNQLFQPPRWVERKETLRFDKSKDAPIEENESVVSVGDRVQLADAKDVDAETVTLFK